MLHLIEIQPTHKGWLNSIEVCTFRELKFDGGQMNFRKYQSGGNGAIIFTIKECNSK